MKENAKDLGLLQGLRVRISVYDEYRHVSDRLLRGGLHPIYGGALYAPDAVFRLLNRELDRIGAQYGITFETCAEPKLQGNCIEHTGCISEKDLRIMGLPVPETSVNPQNRHGCLCLSCKYELLNERRRCPHQCLYCYWRD